MRRPGNNINAQHYDIMFDENAIIYEDIFPQENHLYICSIVQYSGKQKIFMWKTLYLSPEEISES